MGGLTTGVIIAMVAAGIPTSITPAQFAGTAFAASVAISISFGYGLELLPQNARQVPQTVRGRGPSVGGFQFGFEMGTGLRTYMTTALPHVVVVAVVLGANPGAAVAGGLGFGAGRAMMLMQRGAGSRAGAWDGALLRHRALFERGTVIMGSLLLLVAIAAP